MTKPNGSLRATVRRGPAARRDLLAAIDRGLVSRDPNGSDWRVKRYRGLPGADVSKVRASKDVIDALRAEGVIELDERGVWRRTGGV